MQNAFTLLENAVTSIGDYSEQVELTRKFAPQQRDNLVTEIGGLLANLEAHLPFYKERGLGTQAKSYIIKYRHLMATLNCLPEKGS